MELKLFVWREFAPDYTTGLAFAIAENEKEAYDMVAAKYLAQNQPWIPADFGPVEVYEIGKIAFSVTGGG